MKTAYLLQHVHVIDDELEDVIVVGIYSSQENAQQAIARLISQPGFKDFPNLIDAESEENESGFFIEEYTIDEDDWTEGFEVE